jgi:hypothetical protein
MNQQQIDHFLRQTRNFAGHLLISNQLTLDQYQRMVDAAVEWSEAEAALNDQRDSERPMRVTGGAA